MERMLTNLYMVSQQAGVDIEENLPQFRSMLQQSYTSHRPAEYHCTTSFGTHPKAHIRTT